MSTPSARSASRPCGHENADRAPGPRRVRCQSLSRRTLRLILGSENQVPALADGFVLAPPEDALRAVAPIGNDIRGIEQEHRVIARAFDQNAETFLARTQASLGLFEVVDIGGRTEPAQDFAVVPQRNIAADKPPINAILSPHPIFGLKNFTRRERMLPALDRLGRVFW